MPLIKLQYPSYPTKIRKLSGDGEMKSIPFQANQIKRPPVAVLSAMLSVYETASSTPFLQPFVQQASRIVNKRITQIEM